MNKEELRRLLDERYLDITSQPHSFIPNDPVQFPRHFYDSGHSREEVLISAVITAWFSFGNRKAILKKVEQIHTEMLQRSGSLYRYIMDYEALSYAADEKSIYRMFRGRYFYQLCCCIESILENSSNDGFTSLPDGLLTLFSFQPGEYHCFGVPHTVNKRYHMLLRWLVRRDTIDIGLWNNYGTEKLLIPLDTHVSAVSARLWEDMPKGESFKKVQLITGRLREFDPLDPVKYDFSIFSMGLEKFFG